MEEGVRKQSKDRLYPRTKPWGPEIAELYKVAIWGPEVAGAYKVAIWDRETGLPGWAYKQACSKGKVEPFHMRGGGDCQNIPVTGLTQSEKTQLPHWRWLIKILSHSAKMSACVSGVLPEDIKMETEMGKDQMEKVPVGEDLRTSTKLGQYCKRGQWNAISD